MIEDLPIADYITPQEAAEHLIEYKDLAQSRDLAENLDSNFYAVAVKRQQHWVLTPKTN